MISERVASIDIGTNTILMLIGEQDSTGGIVRIAENYSVARLGENVDKTKIISNAAKERAKSILFENKNICKKYKVDKIVTVGTSALRDADNSKEVINEFNEILEFPINIITGEKEAELSYLGTVNNKKASLVIDIGGGSTELIFGKNRKINSKVSLQTGAVRITERFFENNHPPTYDKIIQVEEFIKNQIIHNSFKGNFEKVYAVAGTATTLATTALGLSDSDVDKINGLIINKYDLFRIFDLYMSMKVQDIIKILKIHPKRADLILAGSLIMKTIVEHFNINEIIVSSHGLRYGVLMDYFNSKLN